MPARVLVAGATSALGRHLLPLLKAKGHTVRALTRSAERLAGLPVDQVHTGDALSPETLTGAMDGVDVVFSSVGASVLPDWGDRRSYRAVDIPANLNLLAAAQKAGVRRFVYVSVHHLPSMMGLQYVRAHEQVAGALLASGLEIAILRPTGFFSALGALVDLARKGPMPLLGSGAARSNPIHDADLAEHCAAAIEGGPREVSVGGPDVLTRREMAEAAYAALGTPARFRTAPVGVARTMGLFLRPANPRLSHLIAFVAALSDLDVVAPVAGKRRLADYFRTLARH